jgi:hypothetical protein
VKHGIDFKDYYNIMGLERNASQDEIKRAYRKLARKYHPDVSKATDAEVLFKELGEAYAVLKDPENALPMMNWARTGGRVRNFIHRRTGMPVSSLAVRPLLVISRCIVTFLKRCSATASDLRKRTADTQVFTREVKIIMPRC